MIEKLRKSLDSGVAFTALLTDLSQMFGCLQHDVLNAVICVWY